MGKPTFVLLLMLRNCYKCEMYALNQRFVYSYSLITFFRFFWLREVSVHYGQSQNSLCPLIFFLYLSTFCYCPLFFLRFFFSYLFHCFVHQPSILIIIFPWNANHQVFRFIFLRLLAFGPDFKLS